ncbi:MAG: BamA/TamA family outer membrane protein [Paludibacter sp.]|nr:BamA/TamA family outer membrane protein [Paludibacter sp.]MDD4198448.1 BamA/TamA family outer membrane protein [Paludibacter sp.]MDD4427718.1 BamA/TamA family outer membrane protein [Paludibacter sp.]
MKKINYIFFVCILASCTGTKRLAEGELLYTGAEVHVESKEIIDESRMIATAKQALRPEPNSSLLSMRPKLWLYQIAGKNPKSKFKKWLKEKGEPPVLLRDVRKEAVSEIIDAQLFNIGIFNSRTTSEVVEKKKTAKLIYTADVQTPYKLNEYNINIHDNHIQQLIAENKQSSQIKPGMVYQLDVLRNERTRIDALLKDKGYFYFSPDYLIFRIDTLKSGFNAFNLQLGLKDDVPAQALKPFYIGQVSVDQHYTLQSSSTKDTTTHEQKNYISDLNGKPIRPSVLQRALFLNENELYTRQNHQLTLNRLMSMGNFRFVQVHFTESDSNRLNADIRLTPLPLNTLRAEMDLVTKSNNYTGPRMNVSLLNRNTFGGSELLKLNLAGAFEAQLNRLNENFFSYSFNPQIELIFPRLLVPFRVPLTNRLYTPQTRMALSYNFMRRMDYFDLRNVQFSYGYKWRKDIKSDHELNPVSISNTELMNESQAFQDLLAANPILKKSYEEQFVAGMSYVYTYDEQTISKKPTQFYLNITAESAGNVFSAIRSISGVTPSSDNPATLFGSVYAQFVKFGVDGRMYQRFSDKHLLALRFIGGVAKAYGNSTTLPYNKQFFSGGPSSIRAFPINSVGPGNYQQINTSGFTQLGGDIKLELNVEYRFDIYSFLKGALFIDAGNVWLQPSNPSPTYSPFNISTCIDELAVGTGFGLRFDVSFFVLRFDLATPLRKPWFTQGNRWVVGKINPFTSEWRKENLMLNIAIGYPF